MADTVFIDYSTPVVAAWLNDINFSTYRGPSGYIYTGNGLGTAGTWSPPMMLQTSMRTNYTVVATDAGKHILHPSIDTTPRTVTIPANASVTFATSQATDGVGTAITFINQNGAGVLSIAITSDTMRLAGFGTTGTRTLAANGMATAVKIAATEWIISGTGLT